MPQHANALLQLAFVKHRFISIPMQLGNVRILDCSPAFAVQHVLHMQNALAHRFGWNRCLTRSMAELSFRTPGGFPCASRSMVPAGGSTVAARMLAILSAS